MVRGRDLKTPLAASTMDKAKGNGNGNGLGSKIASGVKGDPPKKSSAKSKKPTKKKYTGDPNKHTKLNYRGKTTYYKKGGVRNLGGFGEAINSGDLKKIVYPDGSVEYTDRKKGRNQGWQKKKKKN